MEHTSHHTPTDGDNNENNDKHSFSNTSATTSTTTRELTRYESAPFWSKLLFLWPYDPLLKLGVQRTINEDDLPEILEADTSAYNRQHFEILWQKAQGNKTGKPNLHKAILKDFLSDLWYIQIASAARLVARIGQAIALGLLIEYFSTPTNANKNAKKGYVWALVLALCSIVTLFEQHHVFMITWRKSLQYKIGAVAAIYAKSLRLSSVSSSGGIDAAAPASGKVMNLASNDVERFTMATLFVSYLFWGPVYAIVVLILGCIMFGPAFACGYSLLVIFVPLQIYLCYRFATLRSKIASITDARVNLVSQAVAGARVTKMSGWELQFKERIQRIRHLESTKIQQANRLRAVNEGIYFCSSIVMSVVTFSAHVALGGVLSPRNVFTAMSLINVAQHDLMRRFSLAVMSVSECYVSITRLQHYLATPELPGTTSSTSCSATSAELSLVDPSIEDDDTSNRSLITLKDVTCYWDLSVVLYEKADTGHNNKQSCTKARIVASPVTTTSPTTPTLDHHEEHGHPRNDSTITDGGSGGIIALSGINLKLRRGELCCIIGSVGSGKSALLQALIGELPNVKGTIEKQYKSLAYASQEPFLMDGSIQENILFGLPMRTTDRWYKQVLDACGLSIDLSQQFHHGDQTIVGDRGVQCSGGQRARIGLARALYRDAEVIVLDDPLSAVDAKVGRLIFDQAIMKLGVQRNKCIVLATHQHQFLSGPSPSSSSSLEHEIATTTDNNRIRCILMSQGRIACDGSYQDCAKVSQSTLMRPLMQQEVGSDTTSLVLEPNTEMTVDSTRGFLEDVGLLEDVMNDKEGLRNNDQNSKKNTEDVNLKEQKFEEEMINGKESVRDSNAEKDDVVPDEVAKEGTFSATNDVSQKSRENAALDHQERRSKGIVHLSTYTNYLKAMGGVWVGLATLGLFALAQVAVLITIAMQGDWAELPPSEQVTTKMYSIILGLGLLVLILSIIRSVCGFYVTIRASRQLHDQMMASVLRAKIEFFDTNPLGRILNRFSADVGIVDDMLPQTIFDFVMCSFMILGGIVTTAVVLPYVLLLFPPFLFYFIYVRRTFVATSRELKRIEGVARSPVFALLGESLQGIATVRSNNSLDYFRRKFETAQNDYCRAVWSFIASSRWMGFRMDCIMTLLLCLSSFLAVIVSDYNWLKVNASLLGLALLLIIQLGSYFQWCVRQSAEVVNYMVSVERIVEFTSLESEAPLETPDDKKHPDWPKHGSIEVQNLVVRYRATLPPSLKGATFHIKSGERIGVVGRTGAGKSTLAQALFRLLEAEVGSIVIDGVDVSKLGLHKLRTQMSVIPQSPILFDGCTIRENLDPFQKHKDDDIWKALQSVQMKEVIINESLPSGLDSIVAEGGSNFSVGQRQLLCLARAILRQNQILILDEPTANVDRSTDKLLQKAAHESFKNSTILAIAHRLDTVIDYDKILVLGNGKVLEFGSPLELLDKQQKNGVFASMVNETGEMMAAELRNLAREAEERRKDRRSQKVNA